MHSMYRLIFSTLHASIICGILAMILVAIVLCFLAYRLRKKIMRPKLLLFILLIGYLAALLYTTILRYVGSTSGFNFHLFRAWREAWNTFSTTSFLNVILSIVIYIPFGALCPMIWKQMRKWWSVALVAILLSTSIEAIQYGLFLRYKHTPTRRPFINIRKLWYCFFEKVGHSSWCSTYTVRE